MSFINPRRVLPPKPYRPPQATAPTVRASVHDPSEGFQVVSARLPMDLYRKAQRLGRGEKSPGQVLRTLLEQAPEPQMPALEPPGAPESHGAANA
jgi:hypothetical protein